MFLFIVDKIVSNVQDKSVSNHDENVCQQRDKVEN